jgi:hypothetical protein
MANLGAILEEAGSGLDRLVKTTVFLTSLSDFQGMNEVYARHVGDTPPARSTVPVAELPAGALVEIEAVALSELDEFYVEYPRIEPVFLAALDESLEPRGPDLLYELVDAMGLPSGSTAADVGCGTGRHACGWPSAGSASSGSTRSA